MVLSYLQLATLIIASFAVGSLLTYWWMKHRIKTLKEYIGTLDASLKGMWDKNDTKQKLSKQPTDFKATSQSVFAKHASDESQTLGKAVSKEV